jgi:hypothetical protein
VPLLLPPPSRQVGSIVSFSPVHISSTVSTRNNQYHSPVESSLWFHVRNANTDPQRGFSFSSTAAASSTPTTPVESNSDVNKPSLSELRDRLGRIAIQQVSRVGWTTKAVTSAILLDGRTSSDNYFSLSMTGMFATPTELVNWYMDDMNHRLKNLFHQQQQQQQLNPEGEVQTSTISSIYDAFKWRLEQIIPLAESGHWHQAMALGLSTPETTRSQLHEFLDIVMMIDNNTKNNIHSNNESATTTTTTTNQYYYRTALGAIFVATELHLLASAESIRSKSVRTTNTTVSNTSANSTDDYGTVTDTSRYADTWLFLKQRLDELDKIAGTGGDLNLTTLTSSSLIPDVMSSVSNDIWTFVSTTAAAATVVGGRGFRKSNNPNVDIAMKTTTAVATSLFEGISSLVLPNSFLTNNKNSNNKHASSSHGSTTTKGDGTRPEDYTSSPSSSRTT